MCSVKCSRKSGTVRELTEMTCKSIKVGRALMLRAWVVDKICRAKIESLQSVQ